MRGLRSWCESASTKCASNSSSAATPHDSPVEPEPLVYRTEVLAIIGALADLVVDVRTIREKLEEDDDEEEEEDAGS